MKDLKLGDDYFRDQGFVKLSVWLKPDVKKKYIDAAQKHKKKTGATPRIFLTQYLTKKAPK